MIKTKEANKVPT